MNSIKAFFKKAVGNNYNFTDLTTLGQKNPDEGFIPAVLTPEQLTQMYPERFMFYIILKNVPKEYLEKALELEGMSRFELDRIKNGMSDIAKQLTKLETIQDLNKKRQSFSGGGYFGELQKELELHNGNPEQIKRIIREYENHPIYAPDNVRASSTDRIIFIAVTYFLRAVALLMVNWGIQNRMINGFDTAFYLYITIYLLLFGFWVLLVNMQTNPNSSLSMLNAVFYYICKKGDPKATFRIVFHVVFYCLLFIIPSIVTDHKYEKLSYVSFGDRQRISQTLSRFSLFVWIITSFVAARL